MLKLSTALIALALTSTAVAQDGPLRRAGRALDNAGKSVRDRVETEVTRGQVVAGERELLSRVTSRIRWDKQLVAAVLQIEIQADGTAILRGSVPTEAAKARAVDLAQSTDGITAVVDELGVAKDVKVIQAAPVVVRPARVMVTPPTTIVVPREARVIVKP